MIHAAPDWPIEPLGFDAEVATLLSASGLPHDDAGEPVVRLFGCRRAGSLCGIVGLEIHAGLALLRSLAVAESARGSGLGAALVAYAEAAAARLGARQVYLLTTTARDYFERLGYVTAAREAAPAAIAATTQFSALCPASAVLMSKSLQPLVPRDPSTLPA